MSPIRPESRQDFEDWRSTALLNLDVAAQKLALSRATLYNLEKSGRLPFVRLAGRTLVRTNDVIKLADSAEPWVPSARTDRARAALAAAKKAN